jgi:hypothetical protein
MNCDKVKDLLGWFYDGELNAADRSLVAQHIDQCPGCRADLAALTELDRASRLLASPEPPADLWERLSPRLAANDAGHVEWFRRLTWKRRTAIAAAILVGILAGGLFAYRMAPRRGPEIPDKADSARDTVAPQKQDPILVNLAKLDPADRVIAEHQKICAAGNCDNRLGAGGPPAKAVWQDKPAFFCCKECEQWALAHPAETLAKIRVLEKSDEQREK